MKQNKNNIRVISGLLAVSVILLSWQSCTDEMPEVLNKSVLIDRTTEPEYVDLGLSVLWATCNMGASTPYEHGGLYAWGELAEKSTYAWSSYKWSKGNKVSLTKYNSNSSYGSDGFVDNKVVLEPTDDVATVLWGEGWRMPTKEEYEELVNNCSWEWVTFDDMDGYMVTSCVPGYTDRSIFLRASGGDWGGGARRTMRQGFYRVADVDLGIPATTMILYFNENTYGMGDGNDRQLGFSVRAVKELPRVEDLTIILSRTALCIEIGRVDTLSAVVKQNYEIVDGDIHWTSSDNKVATVSASGRVVAVAPGTCTITAVSGAQKADCRVDVISASVTPQMVDLGLSVKWATFNVGADSPEKVGTYLAWGETVPKSTYNRVNYKFNTGTYYTVTNKYCDNTDWGVRDDRFVLEPGDDAATVLWGDDWRMPTSSEMDELLENCTWTWTTMNGVDGYKVTSKVTGYTGRSIFLPAAGVCEGNRQMGMGQFGHYMTSSTSDAGYTSAWKLYFDKNGSKRLGANRFSGYPVRPVAKNPDEKKNIIPEQVDLGLSVNWATFNLGASSPGEYGDYLSWGEITGKGYYSTASYSYNYEQYLDMTSGDDISGTQYDAAHVRLGGEWRMPTREECEELVNNCTWSWEQYEGGNWGMKVTAPNGNSIFLPAGGYPNPTWTNVGSYGTYWTATKSTYRSSTSIGSNYSWYFRFDKSMHEVTDYQGATYVGQLLRPVCTSTTYVPITKTGVENGYEYVNLGLSVKWATFNIGATVPEEYGDYYAWGETEPKSIYNWSTYKYSKGTDSTMTKYCSDSEYGYNGYTDSKTVLDPEDDVAHIKWGGKWRMPTKEELTELSNNCTWTWTTYNGVNGYRVTSRKSGYTDCSIFLPAAGCRNNTSLEMDGSNGFYYSSSLGTERPSTAWNRDYSSGYRTVRQLYRIYGLSIRPVCP